MAVTAALISSTPSLITSLFGGSEGGSTSGSGTVTQTNAYGSLVTGTKTGAESRYLDIDEAGVERIVQELLSGTGGLAEVFSGEQASGLYSSSVAAQESGDLIAKVAGEIAKLTAKEVTEFDTKEEAAKTGQDVTTSKQTKSSQTQTESGGLLGGLFGGLF